MFTEAIVRVPGNNFVDGNTTADLGTPDFQKALEQHKQYCYALKKCGLDVTILEADEDYPDGCFVEDTAIVTEKVAIITRPGDISRLGEQEKISEVLSKKKLEHVEYPGRVDGGDVMRVGNHLYIGMSRRTNQEGARQLSEILSKYGYSSSEIPVRSVLHLKTGITYLGNNNFISIDEFSEVFKTSKIIKLDQDESYSANCLLINDYLLIPKGFPKAKQKILELGYRIIEIEMSEYRKMDGGLTCLSLLF
jgi:dimethylargininase